MVHVITILDVDLGSLFWWHLKILISKIKHVSALFQAKDTRGSIIMFCYCPVLWWVHAGGDVIEGEDIFLRTHQHHIGHNCFWTYFSNGRQFCLQMFASWENAWNMGKIQYCWRMWESLKSATFWLKFEAGVIFASAASVTQLQYILTNAAWKKKLKRKSEMEAVFIWNEK